jgi:hypothetical protein
MNHGLAANLASALSVLLFAGSLNGSQEPPSKETLRHDAYMWQRSWNGSVVTALRQHGSQFHRLFVLVAEVTWDGKTLVVKRVSPDFAALAAIRRPVGLALRIGPFGGPFTSNDIVTTSLSALAASLISDAKARGLDADELQIDFDCAESKLEGYRVWVESIRRRIAPVRLSITALPSWQKQSGFRSLIAAADSFVLQVHSVERPRDINTPFTLCVPAAAIRAVERASSFKVPFWVALPTYGYQVAYDPAGRFAGLAAEGSQRIWPAGTQLREVRSDPIEMARLVQHWTTNSLPALQGVIWYRFPVSEDIFNWRWPTLSAMVAARSPTESFRAESRRVEVGLMEISLVNNGELDISSRLAVEVRWSRSGGVRLLAADGLRGFEKVDGGPSTLQFKFRSQSFRLPAGETQVIGWLRFNEDREVEVEVKKF